MQNGLVAAVQASPHKACFNCELSLDGSFLAGHVCPGCGRPQPVGRDESFFTALAAPERFSQNPAELQKKFYEVSRALHPDRFTTSDDESKRHSLERMSYLNDAYRTLRNPRELRDYILTLHGFKSEEGARGQIPVELAEGWFDLQDSLESDSSDAVALLRGFNEKLETYRSSCENKITALEAALDNGAGPSNPDYKNGLSELSKMIRELAYVTSMERDVQKVAANVKGRATHG
jgi:molecular chaperone HscB